MEKLSDCKEIIHSCSKCGLCQAVCPVYKITGNDCTVSKGHFIMLRGFLKGELKMSKTINRYLDLCLKCGACTNFCPSGIDVVDIVALAKAEYFKQNKAEKYKSRILKFLISSLNLIKIFSIKKKSKTFSRKVIFFGGCGAKTEGNSHIIKILNALNIEVITPDFDCCGFPFFVRGDMDNFREYTDKFYTVLANYDGYDILTNCATCEKTLKSYAKWYDGENKKDVNIKNVFEYLRENNFPLELKKKQKVTFHKPCNLENMEDVSWVLNNTKNLEYIEMKEYDKCCGLEGVGNFRDWKIMSKLFKEKHNCIKSAGVRTVLTSCLACQITLNLFSKGKYRVKDFVKYLAKNLK